MKKSNYKTEKETFQALQKLFGKDVFLEGKNAYGDKRSFAFGFRNESLYKRYNTEDICTSLENELSKNNFECVNIYVGSFVHGYIHRVVRLKN